MWPFRIVSSNGPVEYERISTGVSTTTNKNKFHYVAKLSLVNSKEFTIVFTRIGMTLIGV